MTYSTSLVLGTDGSASSHVHNLMGCSALASSKDRVLTKLQLAVPAYFRWLRSHGEDAKIVGRSKIEIVEEIRVKTNAGRAGGPDPLFTCDKVVATSKGISRCRRLLRYTRADLLEIVSQIPKEALNWKPAGEPRTIRNALQHIADVDLWYLSRIRADPPYDRNSRKDIFIFLKHTRSLVHETLPRLTAAQRKDTIYPAKWGGTHWPWTSTKVLHRLVAHERQHTRYLKRILNLPSCPFSSST